MWCRVIGFFASCNLLTTIFRHSNTGQIYMFLYVRQALIFLRKYQSQNETRFNFQDGLGLVDSTQPNICHIEMFSQCDPGASDVWRPSDRIQPRKPASARGRDRSTAPENGVEIMCLYSIRGGFPAYMCHPRN